MNSNGHIRSIFFDFVGTLAFNDPPRAWHYLKACAKRGIFLNRREVWAAVNGVWATIDHEENMAHPEASGSREDYDAFRTDIESQILDALGVEAHKDEIIREVLTVHDDPRAYTLFPEVPETVRRLHDAGYKLCVVSNFSWDLPQLVDALGIGAYMTSAITSARVGYRKPHPRMFEAAVQALDADPLSSLFVGDTYQDDVMGPTSLGFEAILVDRRQNKPYEHPSVRFLDDLLDYLHVSGPLVKNVS